MFCYICIHHGPASPNSTSAPLIVQGRVPLTRFRQSPSTTRVAGLLDWGDAAAGDPAAVPEEVDFGLDPVWWTPCKRGCSSWEVNVGSFLLSTRTRP